MIVHKLYTPYLICLRGIAPSLRLASCPKGRTDQPAIDSQFSQDKVYLVHWNDMDALLYRLHDRREQQVPGPAHSATKDHPLWADYSQNVPYGNPQILPRSLQDSIRNGISFL